MTDSRYADTPGHPLEHVPQEVLDVARASLAELVPYKEIDPDMVEPIADGVVARLAEAGHLKSRLRPGTIGTIATAPEVIGPLQGLRRMTNGMGRVVDRRLFAQVFLIALAVVMVALVVVALVMP